MKPARFQYHSPATVTEVVDLLAEYADDAKVLAGGQSLVPLMSLRFATFGHLVDVNSVEGLDGIERTNGHVRVGAIVRQAAAERDPTIGRDVRLLAEALPHVGHFQIRNRGTVGGSLAHADPASELPAVALALGATFEAVGPSGRREIEAAGFFDGVWETSLEADELLAAVRFPVWEPGSGFAVEEIARRHGDFAICGAACAVTVTDETVTRAAIALFGVGSTPVRAPQAEEALLAGGPRADVAAVAAEVAADIDPSDDLHASGAYRRRVTPVIVKRALSRALLEAAP